MTKAAPPPIDADAFNAFEAAGWDSRAAAYLDFWSPITSQVFQPILDAAAVGPGTRLLDVGCGPGQLSALAAERGAIPIGLDVAPSMVDLAHESYPELEFRIGSAEDLPLEGGSFDAVVANFVLLHLGRPETALREWARVLARNGRLAFSIWEETAVNRLHGLILDAVASVEVTPIDLPEGPPAFRSDDELRALVDSIGLVDGRIEHVSFPVGFRDPIDLWVGILRSGVRFPPLVNAQPPEVQGRIRAAFEELTAVHQRSDGGIDVPAAVQVASGRKP
jgi:SAM-dependent methyltransferase